MAQPIPLDASVENEPDGEVKGVPESSTPQQMMAPALVNPQLLHEARFSSTNVP
jgi:hypothetical protein